MFGISKMFSIHYMICILRMNSISGISISRTICISGMLSNTRIISISGMLGISRMIGISGMIGVTGM